MSVFRESDLPLPAQGASIAGNTMKMVRMGLMTTSAFDVIVLLDLVSFSVT